MRKNYSGSDLGSDFKEFCRKEFRRLKDILREKGCSDIQLNYGFYYFSGFFRSNSEQIYYISCSDIRHFGYEKLLIRTAESYTDFSGGQNQYVGIKKQEILNFNLK